MTLEQAIDYCEQAESTATTIGDQVHWARVDAENRDLHAAEMRLVSAQNAALLIEGKIEDALMAIRSLR